MPTTTPRQVVRRISNKSATIRQSTTSLRQVYNCTINRTSRSGGKCAKMTKICSLEGSQPNFVAIIYAGRPIICRKKTQIGRVLFKQIRLEGVVQTRSSFGNQGHPRSLRLVPFNRRQNFPYCLFPEPYAYLKKQKLVVMATFLEKSKIEVHLLTYLLTAIAEPNGENPE